ncbi:phosphatase PAP2 family protein [Achromobacter deleyi]|uniref:phosphatase PAP2 family protein n=1 Tax=Achromobacter deleyi TaxID=1353891 RepID=UPI001490B8CC|nr:phosphatase PAP2 family protein [Achromobacter deleyi]QVQ26250.1 phosphatase PAP2 family protein [Achromobacter deleyi]UIP21812.1 phosphatase PAP2 family protein [Achromobacter deleyi]
MSSPSLPAPRAPARVSYLLTHVLGVTLILACLAWWANASGLDLRIARTLFDPVLDGFPLHGSRWLELLGHRMVLALPIGVALAAAGVVAASFRIPAWRRWRGAALAVAATCLAGQLLVNQLKHHTTLPRPYDLDTLGGYTPYPLHWWTWARARAGGALPSGHAGAGYAMLSLYFVGWSLGRPAWRWGGLAIGVTAGLGFSVVRILQGAHFLSQTIWSAALMWLLAAVFFYPVILGRPADGPPRADAVS